MRKIYFLLEKAVNILNKGGIIIFPTDTAFGIGCLMNNKKAIKRLYEIRKCPQNKAVPVLVASKEMAFEYLRPVTQKAKELMGDYWPGGLTIVYPCKTKKVPSLIRGGGKNLGIRMPNHSTPLYLIKKLKMPIIGTSANFHKGKTPYKFRDLDKELIKKVDLVIPGKCFKNKTSTVVDCSKKPWRILRQGAVELK